MMKIFALLIPRGKRSLNAVETFAVRWTSYHKGYALATLQEEGQFFATAEEAKAFRRALQEASELLRDGGRQIN